MKRLNISIDLHWMWDPSHISCGGIFWLGNILATTYPKYPNNCKWHNKTRSEHLTSRKAMHWQPASCFNIFLQKMYKYIFLIYFKHTMFILSLLQLLACVSMISWKFVLKQGNVFGQILTFTLLYGSLYSTYMWTGNKSSNTYSQ